MGYQTTGNTSRKVSLDFASDKTVNHMDKDHGPGLGVCRNGRALQIHGGVQGKGEQRWEYVEKGLKGPAACKMGLVSMLVWLSTVLDHCSLSCLLIFFPLNLFLILPLCICTLSPVCVCSVRQAWDLSRSAGRTEGP